MFASLTGSPQLSSGASDTQFQFREPRLARYRLEPVTSAQGPAPAATFPAKAQWLRARPDNGSMNPVEMGSRIVLQLKSPADLQRLLNGRALHLARTVDAAVFILEAPDAWTAAREAQRLAELPEVLASFPVMRRSRKLQGPYARKPNDPYFPSQWHLENRAADGTPTGADLNVRAAWPYARGEGITIALGDDGIELTHPEFIVPSAGAPHFNFVTGETNGMPMSSSSAHATAVAGLAAAQGNNGRGISGVAPAAQLASWVIFDPNDDLISDEKLMDMFQYSSNIVSVQNHSWANADVTQFAPSLLEHIAISNAVQNGRGGKGVVIVRAGGNYREVGGNADDDGYPSDPRVIGVAAARSDGRVASYSNPGACLLVAAFSGDLDAGYPTLFTTDREGSLGYNQINFTNDLADYAFNAYGFSGTSGSAPQIAGLAALILSVNTNLTFRDVQQILIHSARHFDLADPDVTTNGAGFRVSHNLGFGVPDAARAVALARTWINRPPLANVSLTLSEVTPIPDDGLRVVVIGNGVPADLASIPATPSVGLHPDDPTFTLPLRDAGLATNTVTQNLTNKGALILRGPQADFADNRNNFSNKIERVARAGARFAVIYNDRGGDQRIVMGSTDFAPIPAVFISQNDGERLRDLLRTNGDVRARLQLNPASFTFNIPNTLLCEHVALQIQTDHPARGDLRITLVSPQGTRSVLQRINSDTNSTLSDWVYNSTHHFYESSAGAWTLHVSDEQPETTGSVKMASLIIYGTPITDVDHDGLDDAWELANFGSLDQGPKDDPDGDGYCNAREQIMGTNPRIVDVPFKLDVSLFDANVARLSWPSTTNNNYEVLAGTNAAAPLQAVANLPGKFPETEWFTPQTNLTRQFFRVRATPR